MAVVTGSVTGRVAVTGLVHSLGGLPVFSSVVIGSEDGERPLLVASVGRVPR